jgi:predicted esterase
MGKRHSPKTSQRRNLTKRCTTTALAALVATALSSHFVFATAARERSNEVALSSQGRVGAWFLAGPFANTSQLSPAYIPGQGAVEGVNWRSLVQSSGVFDTGVGVLSAGKSQSVLVGNSFRLETAFDGWLLVGIDGAFRLAIDGKWIYRRTVAHRRGRSVEPIALTLSPGLHHVLFAIERNDNRSLFSVELRRRDDFSVPDNVFVAVPSDASSKWVLSKLVDVSLTLDPETTPLALSVVLNPPAGAPRISVPVSIDLVASRNKTKIHWDAGTWDLSRFPVSPFTVRIGPVDRFALGEHSEVVIRVGDATFSRQFSLSSPVQIALEAAIDNLRSSFTSISSASRYSAERASLQYHLAATVEAVFRNDSRALSQSTTQLAFFTETVASNRSPFVGPGWVQAALRSRYDGNPQAVFVHVPSSQNAPSAPKQPLVLALHGYNGNPRRILEAFLDDNGPNAKVPGFVVAPEAHGNAFYRGAAEQAVYDALDWATATYAIDPTRVTITGVSMGGTGAAEIAFRASERFAAAAPLCGYQSFFVRRDTMRKPIRPWEKPLMQLFSPANWAESGNDVPLYVAQGTLDLPLENSRVLTNRYRELGFHLEEDWPKLGHAVWKKTYFHAGLFPWLTKWQKDLDPKYVSLTTGLRRLGKKFWLQITDFESSPELAHADARISPDNRVILHTRSVTGICLHETSHLDPTRAVHVTIDEQPLEVHLDTTRCFEKLDGSWASFTGSNHARRKQPYVEGPWSDLLAEPLIVVYGTNNPKTVELNRFVATRLFEPQPGVNLHIPVVSDRQYSSLLQSYRRAVYVGRPDDHLQFHEIADRLPIRVLSQGIAIGSSFFGEPDVGTAFVYPDLERWDRLLGFVTGNGPEGLLRVLSLPQLVPDFVVFDHGLDAATGEPILGPSAFVRAAGFFRSDWSLPSNIGDSLSPPRSR